MKKHENEIQLAIIEAIKYFFEDSKYGFNLESEKITTLAPTSGGQARYVYDFGRKPYDFAIYALDTVVLFFEVKERDKLGNIQEFKYKQQEMLKTLASNGVDIPYAYNAWNFKLGCNLSKRDTLLQTHVRHAEDMLEKIDIDPVMPAKILEEYLNEVIDSGTKTLVDILIKDVGQMDNFNSMPLMVLINLAQAETKVLIDRAPSGTLRKLKEFFDLDETKREEELSKLSNKKRAEIEPLAKAIFEMKDSWLKQKVIRKTITGKAHHI